MLDIGDTLNLICFKKTGSYLPSGWFGSADWCYKIVDGKKIAVHKSIQNRLSNPFQYIGCEGDFVLDIKRRIVVDDLKKQFAPQISMWAFYGAAIRHLGFAATLNPRHFKKLDELTDHLPEDITRQIQDAVPDAAEWVDKSLNKRPREFWRFIPHNREDSLENGEIYDEELMLRFIQPILMFAPFTLRDYICKWLDRLSTPTKIDKIRRLNDKIRIHQKIYNWQDIDKHGYATLEEWYPSYENKSRIDLECDTSHRVKPAKINWIPYFWNIVAEWRHSPGGSGYHKVGDRLSLGFERRRNAWEYIKDNSPRLDTIEQDHPKKDWQQRYYQSLLSY